MAAYEVFAHDPTTTVSSGGTTAPAQGTSESWTVASSASFPAIVNGTSQFHVADPAAPSELVLVTNVSGTTWTVTRGAGSTTPVAHTAGFTVYQVADAGTLGAFAQTGFGDLGGTGSAPTVTGTHLAAALPVAQGGTGAATQQAALDALAGAVTSGDYLRGNGTHVTMSALQAADFPVLTFTYSSSGAVPSSGTYTAGAVAADQNGIVRVCTASGTPGTWARAGQRPHEFFVDDYGAKGDGKVAGDGVANGTTTFTSATAGFTSADTGKHIMINGANGATAGPLITTITFVNSTTVTLGGAAGASATGCSFAYGSDDTSAINNAVAAAKTFALAGDYFAEVKFGAKIYVLASGPTQTGDGATTITYNSQIPIPYPGTGTTQAETGRKMVFKLTGAGDAGYAQYWDSTTPCITGTALVSMTTAPGSIDATFGAQSVIGGPTSSAGFTGGSGVSILKYANTHAHIQDIGVWCGCYTNQTAFDLTFLASQHIERCQAQIVAVPGYDGTPAGPLLKDIWTQVAFGNLQGVGLRTPAGGNNTVNMCPSFTVEGYTYGVHMSDHLTAGRITSVYTLIAGYVDLGLGAGTCHGITIQNWDVQATQGGLKVNAGGTQPFYANMDCETAAGSVAYDVSDTSNGLYGQLNWTDPADSRSPVISGAAHLKVVNNFIGPGHMASPPAVPATTVAAALVYRDAWVVITSGGAAVSAITVDGTATGLTLGTTGSVTVRVPSGKTIALTYSSTAPTWAWWLD